MVELELEDGLAVVTIDRPHARNAIDPQTMGELEKALDATEGARALVVTGSGEKAFVSGGDLKELARLRTEREAADMALRMRALCDRIAAFPGPVVAALNGHALGGGAEVAVAADIRIAADDVRIGFTQTKLAIVPAWGGAERLARLVGPGRALLLAGTGRVLEAAEAERLGLVDLVLPRAQFAGGWREMARALATPQAREIKNLTTRTRPAREAAGAFARLWVSEEHWEAAERVMSRGK
ncbi:enoyl-CoA hydratase/isomerase family protein [Streptomyces viridochromogenes]|uniref:enoyl-CoA hydratase/isomerase family protein n=1 Tax=Streptomyces viridochromogenes TaxID=1938 RepID=UPI00069DDD38|nr:enoyl-CoA hydratase/isomerase family protein [Streptomyces viridochromogenes]KOG07518.1 enoyl-CoA hydratase [Streptomyces viridochromogenes]KOG12659.1 enoyl-CoA hydratase [Streptomyces viridochromogenes]